MNDRDLRNAYAEVLRGRPGERSACPAPERIRALVERAGPERERLETLDHVMACAGCRAEFDLLRAVADTRPEPSRRWSVPLAAAAAITLLVSAGLLWRSLDRPAPDPALRGGDARWLELLSPSGPLDGAPPRFLWRSAGAGARYRLEIFTPGGDPVFELRLTDTTAVLPDSVRLQAGRTYHWWLVVVPEDGSEFRTGVVTVTP